MIGTGQGEQQHQHHHHPHLPSIPPIKDRHRQTRYYWNHRHCINATLLSIVQPSSLLCSSTTFAPPRLVLHTHPRTSPRPLLDHAPFTLDHQIRLASPSSFYSTLPRFYRYQCFFHVEAAFQRSHRVHQVPALSFSSASAKPGKSLSSLLQQAHLTRATTSPPYLPRNILTC